MAEKKDKEQRKAERNARKAKKQEERNKKLADLEKIKAADASYEESKNSKNKSLGEVASTQNDTKPSQASKPRVMNIAVDPRTGEQKETLYRNIGDYAKDKPEEVASTISGHDPKTETIKQVVNKQKVYDPKNVESLADAVEQSVDETKKEAQTIGFQLNIDNQNRLLQKKEEGQDPRAIEEGYVPYDEGKYIGKVAETGDGQYELTDEQYAQLGNEFKRSMAAREASSPASAIEKLGIEHYYPPQQDFITANFTGRYIGSRQLVAGTGALFPVGLLDARNRAQQAKAKEKAEIEAKFWELASTAPQYDEDYKDVGMNMLDKYYELSGGNVTELLSGHSKLAQQLRRDMYDFESRGKHITEVTTNIKSIMDKLNTGEGEDMYVSPRMYDTMKDFVDGTTDMDAFLNGKTIGEEKLRAISNNVRAYNNFTPLANKQLELLKGQADKMPLRQDVDWSNPMSAANMQEAVSKAGSTRDWNAYTQVVGEYYDLDRVREIVENLHRTNRLWEGTDPKEREEVVRDEMRYVMSMLGKKVDIEQEFKATNALGWASLAHKQSVWNTKKKWRDEDIESMYYGINREMSDEVFQADILQAFNSSNDPIKRRDALARVYQKYGRTPDVTGGYASAKLPTLGETVQSITPNTLQVIGKDGKQRNISTELGIRRVELHKLEKGTPEYEAVLNDVNELKYIQERGSTPTPMNVGSRTVTMSYYDAATNKIVPLESWRGDVDPNMLTNTVHLSGVVGVPTGRLNDNDEEVYRPSTYQYVDNHNLENEGTRRALSSQEGRAESVGWSKEYYYDSGQGGESESSGYSQSTPMGEY